MIAVTGPLWLWSGGQANWHFLTVPEERSGEIRAHSLTQRNPFGSVKVAAAIGQVRWSSSVFPQKSGGYILPVKASVRREAGIVAGDQVSFELEIA